jgi:hypothetical protein
VNELGRKTALEVCLADDYRSGRVDEGCAAQRPLRGRRSDFGEIRRKSELDRAHPANSLDAGVVVAFT